MPQALPLAERAGLDNLPNALSAYNVCLELEAKAATNEGLMHARILGYLILHAPSSDPNSLVEVVRVIHSCARDDETLYALGECFRSWFIRPFKKFKGRTPATSDHPSRPSFEQVRKEQKERITEAPRDHRDAKAKALIRDGYRCVITGKYDVIAEIESHVDMQVIFAAGGTLNTELAHILPESTYFGVSGSSEKKDYAASVLAVMKRFGYDIDKVNGPKVHSLFNVMTMQHDVHDWFDRLDMWFESTAVANHYRLRTTRQSYQLQLPAEVAFTTSDPVNLPCPSRQLLDLHAVCAKIAHLSGASEYIDTFDRDADDLDVLAADGSSSAILAHALLKPTSNSMRPIDAAA